MTISEIAKMAGVSSAAVSRYMNQGSLSLEKRERIKKVIEETNYQPSEYARAMRTKKSRRIGVIVPQLDSEAVPRILSGISSVLEKENYNFMLMNSNRSMKKEINMLETFKHSQVDGLILAASVLTKAHREALSKMPFPVVIVGQHTSSYSCVYHNDFAASYDMMKHLLSSGSKYPAYIGVDRFDKAAGEKRRQGVKKALNESGILIEQIPYIEVDFTMEAGHEGMEKLLDAGEKIDSVFCATDMIAVGAISCLQERGIKVPQDIKVSGIGHGVVADILTPKLTTVHYRYQTSGAEAAKLLLEMIESPGCGRKERMLDYQMMLQGTT
ncbi:MAG: LacI family transcriptional regulator [Clostridia bacterium]|nr:LacI family transcriptional regulator [Clostridia bacterium]NCC44231.1 LacI family transcriptional regulator [Clostridia bacterium]